MRCCAWNLADREGLSHRLTVGTRLALQVGKCAIPPFAMKDLELLAEMSFVVHDIRRLLLPKPGLDASGDPVTHRDAVLVRHGRDRIDDVGL
jgi:hypothetical protein